MTSLTEKLETVKNILAASGGAVIAYSGGVDSTLLAKVAHDVLGEKALMVTAASIFFGESETEAAVGLAKELGFVHLLIHLDLETKEQVLANPPERCYYCKQELIAGLKEIANSHNLPCIFDGSNADDVSDYRPGQLAAKEQGVRSPLQEAGLTKSEIRELAKMYNLPTWDKPSLACLASRIPYHERITKEKLQMTDKAEEYLRKLGFTQLRVRLHGTLARIEILPQELQRIINEADKINNYLKTLGYTYVTVDLQGYRTGSLNEVLPIAKENL